MIQVVCHNRHVPLTAFDFSCALTLPDGSWADMRQTDIQPGNGKNMTFCLSVQPPVQPPFTGTIRMSDASLGRLIAFPGDTRAEQSARKEKRPQAMPATS